MSSYTVNNLNQVSNDPNGSRTYDHNGNTTLSTVYHNHQYDDENQLTSWWAATYYKSDFVYDGLMRLRKRIDYTHNGSGWVLASETLYIYDGRLVVQERNSGNTPQVSYTRGPDLSGTMEGAGGIGGLLARSSGYSGGAHTSHNVYHADGNGNITMMLNASQSAVAIYRYDPYGNTISSSGSLATANSYRFSSKEQMPNSGFYYYGYRFYEPALQRWINRDPLTAANPQRKGYSLPGDELRIYVMVQNNPMSWIDPDGLAAWAPVSIPTLPPVTQIMHCTLGYDEHSWIEFPGGSVGFYPNGGLIGPGYLRSPDQASKDPKKQCTPVRMDSGCFDASKFEKCIKSKAKEGEGPNYNVCTFNCHDWVGKIIKECKKQAKE